MFRFCVANLESSGLFSSVSALNRNISSPEKLNPDLIRGSYIILMNALDQEDFG